MDKATSDFIDGLHNKILEATKSHLKDFGIENAISAASHELKDDMLRIDFKLEIYDIYKD